MHLPLLIIVCGIVSVASPARALTLEERVTVLERTVFTKEDAEKMRREMKEDMAKMNLENRIFTLFVIIVTSITPILTYRRLQEMDKKAEEEKQQKKLESKRSLSKDLSVFLEYFK